MTEFEEITLKKIIKSKIVDEFYIHLNVMLGSRGIKNKELSERIGWDPAGYNQKLNRNSDLRLSTVINIFAAIINLMNEKDDLQQSFYERYEDIGLMDLFSQKAFRLGELFLNVSASVAGEEEFLSTKEHRKTYKSLKNYVLRKKQLPALSEREVEVYLKFYSQIEDQ